MIGEHRLVVSGTEHDLASRLVEWVRKNVPNSDLERGDVRHYHIGAALSEAVLQAHAHYDKVVRPSVERFKAQHPETAVLNGFLSLVQADGLAPPLDWKKGEKLRRLAELALALAGAAVETEDDLGGWLREHGNRMRLRAIRGVGAKTVDYLCLLTGHDTVAVDVHILRLVEDLVGGVLSYEEVHQTVVEAAGRLGCSVADLDWALWRILSSATPPT